LGRNLLPSPLAPQVTVGRPVRRLSSDGGHASIRRHPIEGAPVSFIQIIEFSTANIDDVQKIGNEFREHRQKEGGPAPTRVTLGRDRDHDNVYFNMVQFASYDQAMENSKRSDTSEFSQRLAALCDGPPKFLNIEVISDETI
jgi:hypothetical protein